MEFSEEKLKKACKFILGEKQFGILEKAGMTIPRIATIAAKEAFIQNRDSQDLRKGLRTLDNGGILV